MPRGDGTGPMGGGPMTGRAAGYCAGYGAPGYGNPVGGRGMGFGRGFARGLGRGLGRAFFGARFPGYGSVPVPAYDAEREKAYLEDELASVEGEMKALRDRLSELEKNKK